MRRELAVAAGVWSERLNWLVERVCAVLVGVLVLVVWLGIVSRYAVNLNVTWTEEAARYLMIWAALLAVSSGVARREHVYVEFLFNALPRLAQRVVTIVFDVISIVFFGLLLVYGTSMTQMGASQFSMLFDLSMALPFAAVPVSAGLSLVQLLLTIVARPAAPLSTHAVVEEMQA